MIPPTNHELCRRTRKFSEANRWSSSLTPHREHGMIDIMGTAKQSLSRVLRDAITSSGISFLKLEKMTSVSRGSISRFVNGERDLYLASAEKLAAVLGVEARKKRD